MQFTRYLVPAMLALSLLSESVFAADMAEASKAPAVTAMEPIPPKKDNDLRLFYVDGRMVTGSDSHFSDLRALMNPRPACAEFSLI